MLSKEASDVKLDITQASPMMSGTFGCKGSNSKNNNDCTDDKCLEFLPLLMKLSKYMCGNSCNDSNISDEIRDEEKRMIFEASNMKMNHHTLKLKEEVSTPPLMKESSISSSSCSKTLSSSTNSLLSVDIKDTTPASPSSNSPRNKQQKMTNNKLQSTVGPSKHHCNMLAKECNETKTINKDLIGTYEKYRIHPNYEKLLHTLESKYKIKPHFYNIIEQKSTSYISRNTFAEPMGKTFMIRGKNYLRNKVKVPSDNSIFSLLCVENIPKQSMKKCNRHGISQQSTSFVRKFRMACKRNNIIPPFILVVNLVLPWGNLCSYFYRPDSSSNKQDMASDKLWNEFLTGNKTFRSSVLKLIPRIVYGPWVVKKAVGSSPVIIGQKLPVEYYDDSNCLEICLDVSKGSQMANSISNIVASKSDAVTVDLGFVLEGQKEDYLPERLLAAFRLNHITL